MKHIIIVGSQGVGKSTLIKMILDELKLPVYGFITRKEPENEDGAAEVYIHKAGEKPGYSPSNRIGICRNFKGTGFSEVFDAHAGLIRGLPKDGVVLMDELGTMEREALRFQTAVMDALDEYPLVIAAVRDRENEFLYRVRGHERARCFFITPENRDELFEQVMRSLRE
ncbi:MAG: nucleoside-triphosphatase [Clostridia bacterium]|nr:nucleoside-triphosphatase [Clostridia bacterium]